MANVESMDYDPLVVKLNKDISAIEEAMGAALQQHKFQYIFEGQHGPAVEYKQLTEKCFFFLIIGMCLLFFNQITELGPRIHQ